MNKRAGRSCMLALLLVLAACGTRVPHDEALAIARGGSMDTGGRAGADSPAPDAAGPGTSPAEQVASPAAAGATPAGGAAGAAGAPASGTSVPAAGPKAPIVVGEIGDFSGVVGASFAPSRDAFSAWVQSINAKGGINGHPVKLYSADDGNDGARDLAIAKDFVENKGAIALVNFYSAAGGDVPVARYAESKNVPVIGGGTYSEIFNQSPMMFPQTTGYQTWYKAQPKVLKDGGAKKVAVVYCTEAAVCENNAKTFEGYAKQVGLEIVYEGRVSLAQPDFTAECLNAKAAGADTFIPVVDGNSVNRLAQSCARQSFKPKYMVSAPVGNPPPDLEGAIAILPSFPWTLTSGSPALDEWGQAVRTYAPDALRSSFSSFGWASGKLLQAAAARVSDRPTSAELLEGLYALHNETLGGLAPALNFVRGKPAPEADCVYVMRVAGGKWVATNGVQLTACTR